MWAIILGASVTPLVVTQAITLTLASRRQKA
jgi:hypothetical protein